MTNTRVLRLSIAALSGSLVLGAGLAGSAQAATPYADADLAFATSSTLSTVAAADGTITQVASGLTSAYDGVAADSNQNLYYAGPNDVLKFAAGSSTPTTVASGFSTVDGIAVDSSGNLYVADIGAQTLVKVPADGSAQVTLISNEQFAGVTVDSATGTVYAADPYNSSIVSVPTTGGATTTVATGLGFTTGVAKAPDGSFFATDFFGGTVYHVVNGVGTSIGSFNGPHSVEVDANGNAYIAEAGNGDIVEVPADGSANRTVATNTNGAMGVAVVSTPRSAPTTQPTPAQLPAKTFGFTAHHRADHKIRVRAAGLNPGEAYTITLGKRLVAKGHATSTGQVSAKFKIPSCTYKGKRLLRIIGSQNNRLASKRVWVHKARSASCSSARLPY